ncbi:MAG: hypothetical protein IJ387_05225 [Thermoguttaceae bacterium]|nr:hypothetical protein [Thermoguttaceae bacterium]
MKKRFNDFADYNDDADASNAAPYLRPTRRKERGKQGCFVRLLRTTALLFALLAVALGSVAGLFYWRSVSAPIDVENASTGKLVGWLALRDLSAETPETRERLFERYVETLESEAGVVEPKKLELPQQAKRFARLYFQRVEEAKKTQTRETPNDAAAARRNAKRAPYLRLDYYVAPRTADSTETSEYVVSSDVRPGPALLKRWNAARETSNVDDAERDKTPAVEKNVRLLVMQWFVAKRKAYDAAPDAENARQLEKTRDELLGWQEFYEKIQADATQTTPTRAEMLAEFEKTVDSWNEFATPEELAKTLWFKDLIVAAVAAQETPLGRFAPSTPPRARFAATEETSENADEKKRDFGRRTLDAARRFFFGTPNEADSPAL